MNLKDLDYVLDSEDRFWIVHGAGNGFIYGNLVFSPDKNGDRWNRVTKKYYSKVILKNMEVRDMRNIKIRRVFHPRNFFSKNYGRLSSDWKRIPDALVKVGVKRNSIGIFGSFLIGFDVVKDVDFVVYGIKTCKKVLANLILLRKLIGCKKISKEHVKYQEKKYGRFYSSRTSFKRILSRNLAGMQIRTGVLGTIRFVFGDNELSEDFSFRQGKKKILQGKVVDGFGFNFVPRTAVIRTKEGIVRLLTYNWMLNGCLRKGDLIRVRGRFYKGNKTIYLLNKKDWLKIL